VYLQNIVQGVYYCLVVLNFCFLWQQEAWDLDPKYDDPKIKNKDWFSLNEHWDTNNN